MRYLHNLFKFLLQNYEKTSEIQKESLLFFSFPSAKQFGKAKVTKSLRRSNGKPSNKFGFSLDLH